MAKPVYRLIDIGNDDHSYPMVSHPLQYLKVKRITVLSLVYYYLIEASG